MEQIHTGDLYLTCEFGEGITTIVWSGKSNTRDPYKELNPELTKILKQITGELILDFMQLEYINSSTVVPIIQFLKQADDKNIITKVHYNSNLTWQKSMFKAIANLSKIFKNLTLIEK